MLATLTYLPAGIVAVIVVAWLLALRRWDLLWNRRGAFVAVICALLLLPCLFLARTWAPFQMSFLTEILRRLWTVSGWTFYLKHLPILVSPYLVVVATAGVAIGIWHRRWRRESIVLLVFLGVDYAALSALIAKEGRYGLLLCVPILCFCAIALQSMGEWLGKRIEHTGLPSAAPVFVLAIILCGTQAWIGAQTHVDRIQGFEQVVDFIEQAAPDEAVFYDGHYDGVFTFLVQAGDSGYRRRVVLGAKLLYASAMVPLYRYQSFAASTEEVVERLQKRGGCRWLAVEKSVRSDQIPGSRLLREAPRGPQFELVRSFPISGPDIERVDVYRLKGKIEPVEYVDLPFPILGDKAVYRVRPIQR